MREKLFTKIHHRERKILRWIDWWCICFLTVNCVLPTVGRVVDCLFTFPVGVIATNDVYGMQPPRTCSYVPLMMNRRIETTLNFG